MLIVSFKAVALTGRIADCLYTQGVALGYELLPFTFALPFGQRFSIPLRAGDRWFRVCCFYEILGLQPVLEPHAKLQCKCIMFRSFACMEVIEVITPFGR